MGKKSKRNALNRAVEELASELPGMDIGKETAGIENGRIAVDYVGRLIFCQQLGVMEMIPYFTDKKEIKARIKQLVKQLQERDFSEKSPPLL